MQLPPAQVTRAVIQRYARLLDRYQDELGERPLVLPNGEFFPDEFRGDEDSLHVLAERMQEHAGLRDVPITTRVVSPDGAAPQKSSCGTGACGVPQTTSGLDRLVDEGDSWVFQVPAQELAHPVALTTNLARSLAFVFLVETQKEGERLEPPVDVTADLVAVALGFGVLMLQGSHIYAKSCGGPQIASVTKVGVSELAIAVALFSQLGDHRPAPALKALEATQRAALSEAIKLLKANKSVVEGAKSAPGQLAREQFELTEPGEFLAKMFRKFNRKSVDRLSSLDPNMDLAEVESLIMDMPPSSRAGRKLNRPSDPQKEELKNLVAEALQDSGA